MADYEKIFKALSDKSRLRLMRLLAVTDQQVCVCEMMDAVELPQYQVSRHLGILRNAGLVNNERKGSWIYYSSLTDGTFNQRLFDLLKDQVTEKIFSQDEKKLKKRLSLRQRDQCCVKGLAGRKCEE
jgi:ArsR family transcriptional regulator, arsenate/arsenite/antimonite-responsive transcriptional repressor